MKGKEASEGPRILALEWERRMPRLAIARTLKGIRVVQDRRSLLMVSDGRELARADLLEDGTIEVPVSPGWDTGRIHIPPAHGGNPMGNMLHHMRGTAAELVAQAIVSHLADGTEEGQRRESLEKWALRTAEAQMQRSCRMNLLARQFAQGLAGMTEPGTMEMLRKAALAQRGPETNRHPATLWQYCTARRLGEDFKELTRTNPGAVTWLLRHRHGGPEIRHPGQLVAIIREEMERLGLERKSWRTFATLPPEVTAAISGERRERVSADVLNIMARAQAVPGPNVAASAMNLRMQALPHIHPDTMVRNLRHALGLMFRESGENPREDDRIVIQAQDLVDYLRAISQELKLSKSRTWRGLVRSSERWHQDQVDLALARIAEETPDGPGWESLIGSEQAAGLTATALRTPLDLALEGARMGHCVADYGEQCRSGLSRIFSLEREGRSVATMEIRLEQDAWRLAQVRGRRNEQPGEQALHAATLVAQAYTKAWRESGNP